MSGAETWPGREGLAGLDSSSSHDISRDIADGVGAEGAAADAASTCGSSVGSAGAYCEHHETDDISDILDVGLGEGGESRVVVAVFTSDWRKFLQNVWSGNY